MKFVLFFDASEETMQAMPISFGWQHFALRCLHTFQNKSIKIKSKLGLQT